MGFFLFAIYIYIDGIIIDGIFFIICYPWHLWYLQAEKNQPGTRQTFVSVSEVHLRKSLPLLLVPLSCVSLFFESQVRVNLTYLTKPSCTCMHMQTPTCTLTYTHLHVSDWKLMHLCCSLRPPILVSTQ